MVDIFLPFFLFRSNIINIIHKFLKINRLKFIIERGAEDWRSLRYLKETLVNLNLVKARALT